MKYLLAGVVTLIVLTGGVTLFVVMQHPSGRLGGRTTDPEALNTPYLATTTRNTGITLNANDLLNVRMYAVTIANLAQGTDMTYTLPASSTLRAFVDAIGKEQKVCWFMTATTSDSNIILAAGTGIDLRGASSTKAADGLPSLQFGSEQDACITFKRQPDASLTGLGDITAILEVYSDID
jgi:hypothetical protein